MTLRAFDVSDWGFVRFCGRDAKTFLQGLMTADLRKLAPGAMLPACVLTPKGMLVADCELYEETPECVLAVTRPAAVVGFLAAFDKKMLLSSSEMKCLRAQAAWLAIGEGFSRGLPWTRLSEPARLLLGVDPPEEAELMSSAEFQALRVASGFPWYGTDLDAETLPLEARQEAAISLDKGCYMGQETVARAVYRGRVNRLLVALRFDGAAPPPGTPLSRGGRECGKITSAAGASALAMVRSEDAVPDARFAAGGASASSVPVAAWPQALKRA